MKSIDEVEKDLIEASAEIGGIHECNSPFTYGLARIIWELGKPVEDLTVKQLITVYRQHSENYNRIHSDIEREMREEKAHHGQ